MDYKIFTVIIGMMFVTYLPRMLPLVVLSRVKIHPLVLSWLQYIPVSILTALLAPEILMKEGQMAVSCDNPALLAAFPTFLVAIISKNLFYTVLVGMLAMVLLTK